MPVHIYPFPHPEDATEGFLRDVLGHTSIRNQRSSAGDEDGVGLLEEIREARR